MKSYWFTLLAVLLSFRLAMGQEVPVPVTPEKIAYSKTIPRSLKTFIPRRGRLRFWGETKLLFENKRVWAAVTDVQKTYFQPGDSNVDGIQKSGLDLFVFVRPNRMRRISSTLFTYERFGGYEAGGNFETVGLESTWLDLKTRQRPVFRIKMQNPNGLYGTITEDVLVVFEAGLKKAVTQTGFGQGDSNGADYSSWNTRFVMDEAGQLNVVYSRGGSGGGRETTYKWLRDSFRPILHIESNGLDAPMLPVPLTED